MPRTEWGWMVTAEEIDRWVLPNPSDCDDVLAIDKPAHVVCHPSKHGAWSSLSSAVRERFGLDPVHLVSRLDRETSGVVLIGKTSEAAARLRIQGRRQLSAEVKQELVQKAYLAVLNGILETPTIVEQPLARREAGLFRNQQQVVSEGGQHAVTIFDPLEHAGGFTLVSVRPVTGRMHQIRVHAASMGHGVAGDKLYPDESLQLQFLETGWTEALASRLPTERQALHAVSITIAGETWHAPLPPDLRDFLQRTGFRTIDGSAPLPTG